MPHTPGSMPDPTPDRSPDDEWRDPANWHGGPLGLYYSKRDPRAFVPKRIPVMGVTINFAHPLGIAVLVAVLVAIAAIAYATRARAGLAASPIAR